MHSLNAIKIQKNEFYYLQGEDQEYIGDAQCQVVLQTAIRRDTASLRT